MILTPQYGFRSQCCYAPIKMGQRKIKNTNVKIDIWVCTKCGKRDVPLVQYTKNGAPPSTQSKPIFASKDGIED